MILSLVDKDIVHVDIIICLFINQLLGAGKNNINFRNKSNFYHSDNGSSNDNSDPEEDDSEKNSADNNNLITINPNHNMENLNKLDASKLKSKPLYIHNSLLKDKDII